ncbi:MAG: tRNA pseudouridine(13) synthase TruD [Candidatus Woesearchaeota archaeon]|nr:tRNA pseudouridine(13) synthase TruD [Candidatus Woesearchaeota archaeon]
MRLKTTPTDFIVVEQAEHKVEEGPYTLVQLTKTNMTTEAALQALQKYTKVPRRFIGYAGTKDKIAVTTQYVTVKCTPDALNNFTHDAIQLEVIGTVKEPLVLGMLDGNHFEIIARDCEQKPTERTQIPNYFDEQRFSTSNVAVGRAIVQGKFKEAAVAADEPSVNEYLQEKPTDFVGALRTLPKHTLLMYVHAYQSWLFNDVLRNYIRKHDQDAREIDGSVQLTLPSKELLNEEIPLIGFASALQEPFTTWYNELLQKDNLTQRSFVVRALPFLTLEGTTRSAFFPVKNVEIEKMNEVTYKVCFDLPKGCYATITMKCFFG